MTTDLSFYVKLLSRRFPAMAALFMLSSCIGLVLALRQPDTYYASATLLVESAQIPDDMVRSTIRVDTSQQLEVIQQRLMPRANLIDVARTNRVFPDQGAMNPDTVVRQMRSSTRIRRTSGRDRATLMTIGFEGASPRKVAAVVNQYVTMVLATNSDFRSERAEGALDFFEQEVQTLSDNLDTQSAKIVAFKRENADALPETLDYRLNRQTLLQERLSRAERDLESLISQRDSIKRVYEATGNLTAQARGPLSPAESRLRSLQGELNAALSVYSEENPKVKLLQRRIDALTLQVQNEAAGQVAPEVGDVQQASALDISLTEIDSRITSLRQELTDTTDELERLEDTIDRTPSNRITLSAMERDQANLQNLYSSAVQRLSQARMGERIELSSKGERITVLEPATVPNSPSGPNRAAIIGLGVAVGLGLAGGIFVLLEVLNQSIRRPTDIARALNITPLATIPRFETSADRRWRRTAQLATLAVVVVAVPASLWAVDTYYMPLDQLFEKVMNRLI